MASTEHQHEGTVSPGEIINVDPNPTPEKEEKAEFSDPDSHRKRLTNIQTAQNIQECKKYASNSSKLATCWTVFLIIVVIAQFFARWFGSGLHSEEFIAVVTTTTASVLGFWYLVGRYLFPKEGSGD